MSNAQFVQQRDKSSSTCTRCERTLRTTPSWKMAHASPASSSILPTVLIDTSDDVIGKAVKVIRTATGEEADDVQDDAL